MGSSHAAPPGPRFFSSLFLAGKGLLAFQGLSRGSDLLILDSPRVREPDSPCRTGGTVKSTLRALTNGLRRAARPRKRPGQSDPCRQRALTITSDSPHSFRRQWFSRFPPGHKATPGETTEFASSVRVLVWETFVIRK